MPLHKNSVTLNQEVVPKSLVAARLLDLRRVPPFTPAPGVFQSHHSQGEPNH